MQIILKPLSHPELGDIVLEDHLFPIGRSEEPFATYERDIVAHLSRRHARIFLQDEQLYVADLGSRNGTRLNDKLVEFKPARLLSGDRLSLAGQLDYVVEIKSDDDKAPGEDASAQTLVLEPTGERREVDSITVTRFPFLIGKSDPAFCTAESDNRDLSDYLSRRHAHIFSRAGQLFIEDLGSTNGSFLNGERLDEHAHQLCDGDMLALGGNYFSYRVRLPGAGGAAGASEVQAGNTPSAEPVAVGDGSHTIMVSSADSFLDIFCAETAEEEQAVAEEPVEDGDSAEPAGAHKHSRPGPLKKLGTFRRELQGAFSEESEQKSSLGWYALGVIAVAAAVATWVYYSGKPQRDVEALMAQERYAEAAELANSQLDADAKPRAMAELATEAQANYLLDGWLAMDAEDRLEEADPLLERSRLMAGNKPEATELVDMMTWVTSLQLFVAERGGIDSPVRMYRDEAQIRELLDEWNRSPRENRSRMGLLLGYAPDFKEAHDRTFRQLRSLRNEQSIYLGAIDKLNTTVEQKLARDQADELVDELTAFAEQYPRIGGIQDLQSDLQRYLEVQEAMSGNDRLQAALLIDGTPFITPPFTARAELMQATLLPSQDVIDQFREASEAWREGELSRATTILSQLSDTRGGELAAAELSAKRAVISDYAKLQQARNEPDFGDRVVRFYGRLDPVEDIHFTSALEQEFKQHSADSRRRADEAWQLAATDWDSYRNGGGIKGLLRLEEEVSARFGQQAERLSNAYGSASYAANVYQLLGVTRPEAEAELLRQIETELNLQRRSLKQLSMVLSPEVLATKLSMLAATPAPLQTQD